MVSETSSEKVVEVSSKQSEANSTEPSEMEKSKDDTDSASKQKGIQNGGASPTNDVHNDGDDNSELESSRSQNGNEGEEEEEEEIVTPNGTLVEHSSMNNGGASHSPVMEERVYNEESNLSAMEEHFGVPRQLEEDYEELPEPITMKEFFYRMDLETNDVSEVVSDLTTRVERGEFTSCEHATPTSPCTATPPFAATMDPESHTQALSQTSGRMTIVWTEADSRLVKSKTDEFFEDRRLGKRFKKLPQNPKVFMSVPPGSLSSNPRENGNDEQEEDEGFMVSTTTHVDSPQDDAGSITQDEGESNTSLIEPMEVDLEGESGETEPSNKSTANEKNKETGGHSDSDEDRPTIFVRNFAEITEQQSDDEDDDIVILDPSPKKNRGGDERQTTAGPKTYQKKTGPPKKQLSDFITFDDRAATVEMVVEEKVDAVISEFISKKQEKRDSLREGAFALRKALLERRKLRQEKANSSLMQVPITMTPSRPRLATPIQVSRPRGPAPVHMQQSIQPNYQKVSMPGLAPLSIIAPNGTTNVPISQFQQANTFTQVSSTSGLPRMTTAANTNNQTVNPGGMQQLGSQLFFDSTKGLLYTVPNMNQGAPHQQNVPQANNQMNPANAIQPQLQPQPAQVRAQPPPPPVRIRQPIPPPRPVAAPRMQRQVYPMQNTTVRPQQMLIANQNRLQRPTQINVPAALSQLQFNARLAAPAQAEPSRMPTAQVAQNSQRSLLLSNTANRPVLTNSLQKMNSAPNIQRSKPASNPINSNATADSGLTAGTQRPVPGTVEENEAEPQNKTFPSLVVHVKTCLKIKPSRQMNAKSRSDLDAKVKSVLIHTPAKFAEWMMRRGLVKLEHKCIYPHHQALKLGMYSDDTRQPFSGGYVWTSECCPERQISIFSGSIFEGSKYPPGTVLKLVYHWSCQTPANNILQWVKISSFYLKNFFTLLRAICISYLHEHCPILGGEMKFVEIGVITLGSSAETSRGVKSVNVEILGVFDPSTKIIRMKVINSLQGLSKDKGKFGPNEQGARAFQILWPLTHWVDKRSTLLVDGIIDKTLFHELGFKNIQQCGENAPKNAPTNCNVMNYLRQIVPKMFASTLSVLSKSIVQQFLDELSWRELYGLTVLQSFENMLDHIAEMTKWNLNGGLIPRLNKVSQNPFADWSFTKQTRRSPLNTIPMTLRNEAGIRECIQYILKDESANQAAISTTTPPPSVPTPTATVAPKPPAPAPAPLQLQPLTMSGEKRKIPETPPTPRQNKIAYYQKSAKHITLEKYYYGVSTIRTTKSWSNTPFNSNIKCPLCVRTFASSREIIRHIAAHVAGHPKTAENSLCACCLKAVPSTADHRRDVHELVDCVHPCHFCQITFTTEMELVIHMWDLHVEAEAPYVCDICDFASSFHCDVIDHFNERHGDSCYVMCPYCLKVLSAKSFSFLKTIVVHLQSHQLKRTKKCTKCILSFGNDIDLRNHMAAHASKADLGNAWLRTTRQFPLKILMPTPPAIKAQSSSNFTDSSLQKSKKRKLITEKKRSPEPKSTLNTPFSVPLPIDPTEKFAGSRYKITLPDIEQGKAICSECKVDIMTPNHFIGRISCTKCRFTTSCRQAMDIHHDANHQPNSVSIRPILPTRREKMLNDPLVCKCGYLSRSPYKLADHLVRCERYTVYPKNRTPLYTEVMGDDVPPSLPVQHLLTISETNSKPSSSTNVTEEETTTDKTDEVDGFLPFSMNTSLEALSLPPVLSPSAPMPDSPFGEISGFEDNVNALLQDLL
ncbi:Pogo transposable element with ZNF domain [Orchesella cincta]|uniref:Pogo transposable element with ZNF domain n=1 Tax=Orchesella cincta TaxID=48709 RepID=A0A1D2N6T8_ORCCI|nr:Pogo transposable element with ZNF domain [Orchesella cincta]